MSTNRVAMVTGASRGIGAAIMKKLAADGFSVVVNYASNANDAEATAGRIGKAGGNALLAKADISDPEAVASMWKAAEAAFGGVDVLVNNAAIMRLATIAEVDDALVDDLIDINLKGSINNMREAARRLRNGGRIINLSSSAIGLSLPTYAIYIATKAAIEAMTPVLAKEMRGRDVTVNAVAPGPTATALFLDGKSPELIDHLAKLNPMERLGTPEDIANVVAFLAGPEGLWINGQVLRANGGMI